jgi:hypothetical protein
MYKTVHYVLIPLLLFMEYIRSMQQRATVHYVYIMAYTRSKERVYKNPLK